MGAGVGVDLVVAGAAVAEVDPGFGQGGAEFAVEAARDADGGEGAVGGDDAVEGAGLAG